MLIVVTTWITLVVSCSTETNDTTKHKVMPNVNDENCKTENISMIEDKEMRQEFVSKCLRRGELEHSNEIKLKI
jgi:entry exclusion lipoprotein TrbK